ncbi:MULTISPECIES: sulfur carrier protein ThiS [Tenacibaculum]|uniref:Sulfur carrier protein ThiS n=1 Tax=Tenacibaculum aiptasiae TaxID=426481 RepID=A0A7J5ACA7_9FLAO|nr:MULTISPECIES: sulfur carrier protein ThiS [Tenacibaculum]KAB1155165.1 sulfur carrier protein ThiS [Tenacibaculum aiptasiae]MCF2873257.1 sulfur carrier protein ThiS [Tenacibaculum sp. Cn5-1]MCF2933413.1 sulfur carrier protein ThiS [Tenacibaculum sp. Cn5-34]MCG7510006.1 sulfur carrier protein ThiS [Tenacibaculum sp. Cn5-46]
MILIKVNENKHQFSNNLTVKELIENLKVQTNGIALAVNNNVIKKENWTSETLQNNDEVLIIKSTQGG